MPLYTKAAELAFNATGIGTDYPSPTDYAPNGFIYGATLPLYPFGNYNNSDGGPIAAFNWDAANWGAVLTVDTVVSGQDLPSAPIVPFGGSYVALGTNLETFTSPTNVTFAAAAFPMILGDTQQVGVALTYNSSITYLEPEGGPGGFGTAGGIPQFLNGTDPITIITRRYPSGPEYYWSGACYDGVLTAYNIAKFDGSLLYQPFAIFGNVAPYKMLACDVVGRPFAEADFTPEPFGGDNQAGTFTNTELDPITFDDPVIQDIVDNGIYYDAPIFDPANDIAYAGFETGADEITYIGMMPLTQTYDVMTVTGIQSITNQLYADGYAFVFPRFDSAGPSITLYGMGFVEPPVPITVPVFTAVRLPCIVNCVPLIDRRYSR